MKRVTAHAAPRHRYDDCLNGANRHEVTIPPGT
jgi:hypothetical protein